MKKKKLLFAILCALGGAMVGFFANQLPKYMVVLHLVLVLALWSIQLSI